MEVEGGWGFSDRSRRCGCTVRGAALVGITLGGEPAVVVGAIALEDDAAGIGVVVAGEDVVSGVGVAVVGSALEVVDVGVGSAGAAAATPMLLNVSMLARATADSGARQRRCRPTRRREGCANGVSFAMKCPVSSQEPRSFSLKNPKKAFSQQLTILRSVVSRLRYPILRAMLTRSAVARWLPWKSVFGRCSSTANAGARVQ
ncbi:hypothetical protein [Speluncibacter jeojiensis]|uniref:Uncharacterized protein n=1 Tax=Speluncibacter jeojiensis TaxID=2710754 RepID=A0A9X4RG09_9ACTN|nr:hypothetical protein [Corynebacteriales bacterium D3-21]